MADLTYKATVDVSQAEQNLSKLQKSVSGLNDTFIRLKSTLATISLGAVISQSLQFADAISDLSDASEIAIGNIIGFQNAVMASGGSADGAQKAILKLVNSIGEAADGSLSLQRAFGEVGITLNDLATMSNQDILAKTISGLDKMENSAKRSVLVTQLLGKEFRNVASGQLGAAYAQATAESAKYADAIAKGAAAQQNIDKTLSEFKIGLLEAIKPLTDLISKVNVGVENFQKFVQALLAVGAALLTVSAAGRVWNVLKLVAVALAEIWSSAKAAAFAFGGFIAIARAVISDLAALSTYSARWQGIKIVIQGIANVIGSALAPAFTALKGLALPILAGIAGYWGWIQENTGAAIDKLREYASALTFGLISGPDKKNGSQADVRRVDNSLEEQSTKEKNALREVQDALQKRRLEIQKASIAFKEQNNQIIDNINLEKSFIGKTEDFIEVERAREEVFKRAADEANKLREAKKLLTKDEQALAGVYDQQIAKIAETAGKDAERIARSIEGLQGLRLVENARKQDIENTTKAIEGQISRQQQLGDVLRGINDKIKEQLFSDSLKGKSPLEQQVAQVIETARKGSLEAGRAFAENFGDTTDPLGMTIEQSKELALGLDQISSAYGRVAKQAYEALGVTTEFATGNLTAIQAIQEQIRSGLGSAWDEYKTKALDTAGQIKSSFENFTQGMEDAFVRFAQTGKLSFKDLANSIIADLAKIAFKKAVIGMASLFGFAAGGQVMADTPIIVGERGPELFVPRSAGAIVPNNALGGMANASNQGGGGQTTVNYNIQAVDAASFRSLVARDPSFIYAVTEQGRRSQPTRSR